MISYHVVNKNISYLLKDTSELVSRWKKLQQPLHKSIFKLSQKQQVFSITDRTALQNLQSNCFEPHSQKFNLKGLIHFNKKSKLRHELFALESSNLATTQIRASRTTVEFPLRVENKYARSAARMNCARAEVSGSTGFSMSLCRVLVNAIYVVCTKISVAIISGKTLRAAPRVFANVNFSS